MLVYKSLKLKSNHVNKDTQILTIFSFSSNHFLFKFYYLCVYSEKYLFLLELAAVLSYTNTNYNLKGD